MSHQVDTTGSVAGESVPRIVPDPRTEFASTSKRLAPVAKLTASAVRSDPSVMDAKRPNRAFPPGSLTARYPLTVATVLSFALLRARKFGVAPTHTPPTHASMMVHAWPSSQGEPSGRSVCAHPPIGSHVSTVHGFPSSQWSGVPGWQPVSESQVSRPLHTSLSSQVSGTPLAHWPDWQLPFEVQRSPHGVPLGTNPSPGHGAPPPAHVSATSHTVAGARHTVPAGSGGCVQLPEPSHTSAVHALPSSPQGTNGVDSHASEVSLHVVAQSVDWTQGSPAWPVQSPVWQVSAPLQKRPSSHAVPSGWN